MFGCKCSNNLLSKLIHFSLSGRELTQGHQLGLAGGVSFPVFWLAGAGSAVFWVLGEFFHLHLILLLCFSPNSLFLKLGFFFSGATLAVIGSHAAFRELESSDMDELLMEPV